MVKVNARPITTVSPLSSCTREPVKNFTRHSVAQVEAIGNEREHGDCGRPHSDADRRDFCGCHDSVPAALATDPHGPGYAQRPLVHAGEHALVESADALVTR